jgi:hypothetical protein
LSPCGLPNGGIIIVKRISSLQARQCGLATCSVTLDDMTASGVNPSAIKGSLPIKGSLEW